MVAREARVVLSFLILVTPSLLWSAVKGSEASVSVESAYTFPAIDNDNSMMGFGWFRNGFSLEDNTTTCSFNSVYPVSGAVDLNGGTLYLNQDLLFKNVTTLNGLGTIIGDNHVVELCESIDSLPADTAVFENVNLFFTTDLTLNSTIILKGDCLLYGNTHSLFMDNGAIVIDSDSHLEIRDIEIEDVMNENIKCVDDSGSITLSNVRWIQSGDFDFKKGSLLLKDPVTFIGPYTLNYTSVQTSTIAANTFVHVTDDLHLCLGRDPIAQNEPLAFTNETSVLNLDNCSLIISGSGANFTKGTMQLDRNINVSIMSTGTENGFMLGAGESSLDQNMYFSPSAVVNLTQGHLIFNNIAPDKIRSTSVGAQVIRHLASHVYFHQNSALSEISLELLSNYATPLQIAAGKTLSFDRVVITLPDIEFRITGNQYSEYSYLLGVDDEFFITKGILPLGLIVAGSGNKLRGNGGLSGPVILTGPSAELSCSIGDFVNNTITLNGGKITLESDLVLPPSGDIVGPGNVDIVDNDLHFGGTQRTPNTDINWEGNGGNINLDGQMKLSSVWTFSGNCAINGNNNKLELLSGGEIVIQPNSRLTVKNVRLVGIKDGNVRCVDDTGSLVIDDVFWVQDSAYTFTSGAIEFLNRVNFMGTSTFSYSSKLTSTIAPNSELRVTDGVVFSIGRNPETLNEPLNFEDNTSILRLDNCTFDITYPGFNITKGILFLDRNLVIDIHSTSTDTGLVLGDATEAGDAKVYVSPSCAIDFNSGHLTYNNTDPKLFISTSKTAKIKRYEGADFYVAQSITFKNITSELSADTVSAIGIADGQSLIHDGIAISFPGAEFDIKGTQPNGVSFQLNNNDYISLLRGDFPLAVLIAGAGNTIRGNGTLLSPVVFLTPLGQLVWTAIGSIASDITLSGGNLILENDLFLASGGVINGPGTVTLNDHRLRFSPQNTTWDSAITWEGNEALIDLKAPITLSGTWTFTGNSTINGRNNTLKLDVGGQIIIEDGATLTLRDIVLEGVQGSNVSCNGSGSILSLDNVVWEQSGDAQFAQGALSIHNKVKMLGANTTFAYQAVQTSTIQRESKLKLDSAFTFSYDTSAKNLLEFEDASSILQLSGATFHATGTGIQFKQGMIDVRRNSAMAVERDGEYDEGITIGDGTVSNDCTVVIANGAQLSIGQGTFNYRNIDDTSWDMLGDQSSLRMVTTTTLRVFENLNLDDGNVLFEDGTTLAVAAGKNIIGAVHPLGDVSSYEM